MAETAASEPSTKPEATTTDAIANDSEKVDAEKNGASANTANEDAESKVANDQTSTSKNNSSPAKHDNHSKSRGGFNKGKNFRGNKNAGGKYGNKFDPSSAKETDDPVEIRKQVEFYFSDSNLPNDKFLFETIGGSENKPVPIKTIHNFKRMHRFQPFSAVVAALKDSTTLDVVEDDTAIQRKTPLPEGTGSTQPEIQKVFEDQAMSRSIYAKGFGSEGPSSQFDIEAWFSEFGATNQVRLRRTQDSSFKGSVFVEFDSEETAKKFLSLDPAPKYNGKALIIKSKKQYCDEKVDDLNSGAKRLEEPDADDWKARRELDRKRGFPSNKQNGRGRGGGRGGNRGRGSDRHHNTRSNGSRGRTGDDEDKEDDLRAATEDKKRGREGEDEQDIPVAKKTAVESES